MPDYQTTNEGSLVMFRPTNKISRDHLLGRCADAQWFGGALACEHRYAGDLAERLREDGFSVE